MGVSFSLSRPKSARSSIRVKVSVSGVSIFLYTGRSIETCHWDKKKCFVKAYVGKNSTSLLIQRLKELEIEILSLLDCYRNGKPKLSFVEFQTKLLALVKHPKNMANQKGIELSKGSFIGFVDQFILDCESGQRLSPKRQKLKSSSIASYKTTKGYLMKYEVQKNLFLTLKDFSQSDIDKFSDFLIIDEEFAMNTHAKCMMDLLQIIKYAVKLKKIPASKLVELEFDTRREETDSIYLTEEEILQLLEIKDFDDPVHEQVRDVFVLGCFTAMRFSDYSTIDPAAIRNNRLEFVQKKTGGKVTIPIHPVVKSILDKYKNVLPQVPKNNEFNRIIKIVGEKLPCLHIPFTMQVTYGRELKELVDMKYNYLQTHTARRSFCSNEYIKGTDPLIIMSISGHKSHKSFMRYIKISGEQFAEKLEKIWAERIVV
ncbi:MAG: site-specific integrase [Sediminibacterium sp.]